MDIDCLYALHRYAWAIPPETITDWIERPHLLQPRLVGVTEAPMVTDRQTNGTPVRLHLAVWVWQQPFLHGWPIQPNIDNDRLWLLTTWTTDSGAQHRLSVYAVAETFADLLGSWRGVAAAVPLDSEWLTPEDRSRLVLAASTG